MVPGRFRGHGCRGAVAANERGSQHGGAPGNIGRSVWGREAWAVRGISLRPTTAAGGQGTMGAVADGRSWARSPAGESGRDRRREKLGGVAGVGTGCSGRRVNGELGEDVLLGWDFSFLESV
jgi:hypothetical protein